jgi:hypothetical protein
VAVVIGLGELPIGLAGRGVSWSLDRRGVARLAEGLDLPGAATDLAEAPAATAEARVSEFPSKPGQGQPPASIVAMAFSRSNISSVGIALRGTRPTPEGGPLLGRIAFN